MSPTLIHYHMDHSRFLPWLICKFPPISEKPHLYHLPFIYLILVHVNVHFQYIQVAVSELLAYSPGANNLLSTVLVCRVFHLQSYRFDWFPELLKSASSPLSPSGRMFHTFRLSYHRLHSFLGPFNRLNNFLSLHTLRFIPWVVKFFGSWEACNVMYLVQYHAE